MTVNIYSKVNPFTLEIVKESLVSIGDEMFYTLGRTSMSPIIYEVLDYACGLTDSKGELLTQGNGVTGFIGTLTFMVKETLDKFDGELYPGDVIIINDPYGGGGTHLSDVGLVMPIFFEESLVAFSVNKAHWTEVGGKDPGSWTTDATEIFQEGMQFPCVKLFESGKLNQALADMIDANVRFPELSLGDMWAQVAALRIGEKKFTEICSKYGKEIVLNSIEYLLDHGEKMARKALSIMPYGTYEASDLIESDGLGNGPFPVKVKVTITQDEFICDYRGSHPQVVGPINSSYTALVSSVRNIFIAITNPSQQVNDGIFRPLRIMVDDGSIFSAKRPAPVSAYWESKTFALDLLWKALAPIISDKLTAGHYLSVCAAVLSGTHQESDVPFLWVEPTAGGWGAGKGMDGSAAQFCAGNGETYNIPVEVAEKRYGILMKEYKLHIAGAGDGKYRGGPGVIRSYQTMNENQKLTATFGRHQSSPWGFNGGHEGSSNYIEIVKTDGTVAGPYGKCARYELEKGDVVRLVTGTGGGYGHPYQRPVEKVLSDVKNGYISGQHAEEIYGVTMDPDSFQVKSVHPDRK